MALMHMKRSTNRGRNLCSSIYEDNYGYTMNYYQPMIDYLDAKTQGRRQTQLPILPWSYERGLDQYRSRNSVKTYSSEEILKLSRSAAAKADQDLINARVIIRTPFSVRKTADAARILKHIRPDTIIERSNQRYVQRLQELREQERNEILRILRFRRRMDDSRDVVISADLKRAIRGKSANAITAALLAESEKNMKQSKIDEEQFVAQARAQSVKQTTRGISENRIIHSAHIEIMDDRLIDTLDHRVSSSLCNVKRQLSNLNQKTVEFYADSRCVPDRKCQLCREVNTRHFLPQYYVHLDCVHSN